MLAKSDAWLAAGVVCAPAGTGERPSRASSDRIRGRRMRYLSGAKVAIQERTRPASSRFPWKADTEDTGKNNLKIVMIFYIR